ncbi:CD151 antigen-like [Styela clava]|uniref:CD151 antigen-like n=1 Tax=Styela clava TaxID=7725 RepID=UPI0019399E91|nr:CD151 antigen-like [Styela clava]
MAKSKNSKEYDSPSDRTCDVTCLRGVLIACNFFFILGGGSALALGIWSIIAKMEYAALLTSAFYTLVVYMLIGAGAVILITGIIGCVGAIQKSPRTLMIYFILLVILFIIELLAGILAFVYHESIHSELHNELAGNLAKNYNVTGQEALTKAVDLMQQDFMCCGVSSYADWQSSRFYVENGRDLKTPESCCKTVTPGCSVRDHPSNIYRIKGVDSMGCLTRLEQYLKDHLFILAIAGIVVAGIEILVIVFACCLRKAVLEDEQSY